MPHDQELSEQDVAFMSSVLKTLARNLDKLEPARRLCALNLLLKLTIARDARDAIIPPMNDLVKSEDDEAEPEEERCPGSIQS